VGSFPRGIMPTHGLDFVGRLLAFRRG
jgi:hypothetical protein